MTQDEKIELIKKTGIDEWWDSGNEQYEVLQQHLDRLVELVAAREREACAKLCDELSDKHTWEGSYADECAQAIRARGQA